MRGSTYTLDIKFLQNLQPEVRVLTYINIHTVIYFFNLSTRYIINTEHNSSRFDDNEREIVVRNCLNFYQLF